MVVPFLLLLLMWRSLQVETLIRSVVIGMLMLLLLLHDHRMVALHGHQVGVWSSLWVEGGPLLVRVGAHQGVGKETRTIGGGGWIVVVVAATDTEMGWRHWWIVIRGHCVTHKQVGRSTVWVAVVFIIIIEAHCHFGASLLDRFTIPRTCVGG